MTPATLTPERHSRILIAGADPEQRAAVLHDLSEALPANTLIGEACAVSEVLEQASFSSVVMLAGDLGEVSAESLMHELGSRHPSLPVIALGLSGDRGARAAAASAAV
jgi:DNA-binding NtrC family response regulator